MTVKKILFTIISCVSIAAMIFLVFSYFHRQEIFTEVKRVTEAKIGDLLRAKVSIDNIKIGVLNEISLSQFRINERRKNSLFSFVNVKKIVLRLNPLSYLLQPFRVPNTILMDSPDLRLQLPKEKDASFDWEPFFLWKNLALVIKDGQAEYPLGAFDESLFIDDINGRVMASGNKSYEFWFFANIDSIARGSVALTGKVDSEKEDVNMHVVLDNLQFDDDLWMPIDSLSADFKVTKDTLRIDSLKIRLRNMEVDITGVVTGYLHEPHFDLSVSSLGNTFKIKGGFPERSMAMTADLFGVSYAIEGVLERVPSGITFPIVGTNHRGYEMTAELSWGTRECVIVIQNKDKEIGIDFSHNSNESRVDLDLNHVELFGYDVVFNGALMLTLLSSPANADTPIRADITTDYFIFNYLPLKEFQGTSFFGSHGMENLDVTWGDVYRLTGSVGFDELNQADLLLVINDFDLSGLTEFYSEQTRLNLAGLLGGTINLKGVANNPDINGSLEVKDGVLKSFDFEEANIHFNGNKFLLKLHDSTIKNSTRTFYIKGDVDFTRQNPMTGITVQTGERVIIWKGLDISTDKDQDGIAFTTRMSDTMTLRSETLKSDEESQAFSQKVSLDYDFRDMQTLSLEASEADDEEVVALRHKFRF